MTAPRPRLRLIDLTALVVGYGLAALLVRAFWPSDGLPLDRAMFVLMVVYLWLGLAMGGPIVLLFDRRARPAREGRPALRRTGQRRPFDVDLRPAAVPEPPPLYSWAEKAWLLIGSYWIVLTVFIAAVRLNDRVLLWLGLVQAVPIVVIWLGAPRRPVADDDHPPWTHRAAIALILTWPLAWLGMVLLIKTL